MPGTGMVAIKITGAKIEPVIDLPPTATNLNLKEKIQELTGVAIARQTLVWGEAEFADGVTIGEQVPLPDSVRLLVLPLFGENYKFHIKVKLSTTEVHRLRVRETMTVADFKFKVERKCEISSEGMKAIRLGEEMEDDFPLSAYYINEGAEVEVIPTLFNSFY